MDNFESICCSDEQRPNLYHRHNYNIDSEINFRRTVYEGGKQELLFGIDIKPVLTSRRMFTSPLITPHIVYNKTSKRFTR